MKAILMTLVLLASMTANAEVQTLLTTSNNNDNLISDLKVHTDANGDIVKFEEYATKDGKVMKHNFFTIEQVTTGVVLHVEKGRAVYKLKSNNLTAHQGGIWKMSYLHNGITNSWLTKDVDLRRDGDTWSVYFDGSRVTKVYIKVNRKPIIGVIGVSDTIFN